MLLFLFFLFVQLSDQTAIRQTCTTSHIWLESNDDQMALSALDKQHCVATYRSQTVVDRYCLGPNGNLTLTVSPKILWTDLGNNVVVSCPDISADELLYPVSTSLTVQSDGKVEITIEEHRKLILSSRLAVADCFIFSVDGPKIDLLDKNGCPVDQRLSELEDSQLGTRKTLTGRLSPSLFPLTPSAQLQCSVVSCGSDCFQPCGERNNEITSSRILLSTFVPTLHEPSALRLQACSWWLQRALSLLIATSLLVSTSLLAYLAYRNCPWTLEQIRQMLRLDRRRRRRQLQIIHPIDMFDSPPVITKRLSSRKKRATSYSSMSSKETKRATKHGSVKSRDVRLAATFMESLPEPPKVPVSRLAEIVQRRRSIDEKYAEICKAPTPLKRTISKTSTNNQLSQLTSDNLKVHNDIQKNVRKLDHRRHSFSYFDDVQDV